MSLRQAGGVLPLPGSKRPGFRGMAVAEQLWVENYAGTFDDANWPLMEGVNPVTLGLIGTPAK